MKKLVLITTSLFLISTIFGQEQQPERIQQQKTTTNAKSVQVNEGETPNQLSTKTTSADYPITYSVGSDGVQHVVKEVKNPEDFSTETITAVEKQLKELYGEYYEEYGAPNIGFYAEFYERCEFIPLSSVTSGIQNISSLDVKDKYNPEKIYHDNLQEFNAEKFNVLKYQFEYYNETDQYYRIYNTDMVLKINKLN